MYNVDSDSSSSSDDDDDDDDDDVGKESVVQLEQERETETLEEESEKPVQKSVMDWETIDLCREVARLISQLEKTKSELRNTKGSIWALRSHQQKEL
jgi:hypothetical protein